MEDVKRSGEGDGLSLGLLQQVLKVVCARCVLPADLKLGACLARAVPDSWNTTNASNASSRCHLYVVDVARLQ